jgi:D-sedoheptulose 7-phosphate isomerase
VDYIENYFNETKQIIDLIDREELSKLIKHLELLKKNNGRLFFIGLGGSSANASHAVNDFRKILGIESYSPADNVAELTARINDDGWESVFHNWLIVSKFCENDALFVFSVGGGSKEYNVSINIVRAIDFARERQAKVLGIVGRDGGHTAKNSDACVIVPTVSHERITPHTEAFQAVIWHLIISHPSLDPALTKWESKVAKN